MLHRRTATKFLAGSILTVLALASCAFPTGRKAATQPASAAPIRVGFLEPLTGPLAEAGKDNRDGFSLYLSSVGGTVAGRRIEPVFADTQGAADVALTKTKELVERERVSLLMGLTVTPVCYAVAGYVKTSQVPALVTGGCAAQGLTTDPRFKSPYLVRMAVTSTEEGDPPADWAYNHGYRRATLIASDFGGGLEISDAFASAFVRRGGEIVQELYPALGTADFGPLIAQLRSNSDLLVTVLGGVDGRRFLEQYRSYAGSGKTAIIDDLGSMTDGPNLAALGEKALGVVGVNFYTEALDTPESHAFLQTFHQRYPGRNVSGNAALGYSGAQALAEAIRKVNGQVERKADFLQALYALNAVTARGPIRLDGNHDIVQNVYVFEVTRNGGAIGPRLLHTYANVSPGWDRQAQELAHFPFGHLKGKWVGMTKEQLNQLSR
ncbi:MAG: ABC transporter substrate-binding protein [Chloroflexota bacterium]|nr:ABC transporter substrate-binding protein [Chloroflexota bacterium]